MELIMPSIYLHLKNHQHNIVYINKKNFDDYFKNYQFQQEISYLKSTSETI